jgi:hypothetical protein
MEMDSVWSNWGSEVTVLSVDGSLPYARVWRNSHLKQVVEIGPGFLSPFLATTGEGGGL